jgi:glycosyltransferase involved in cell wall biosynthesis
MTPLVSILMPVRDAEATLAAALESIRRQRGVTWECIAVDDGSKDASRRCLERAKDVDPRVRVLVQSPLGIVAALEHGLQHCRGQLVARMDADDLMARDRLRLQADALERDAGLAAVGCHVRMFPRRQLSPRRRAYESWLNAIRSEADILREAFVECPLAHPTLMLRRSVLERHRYRDCGWPEDYDLLSRLLESGERLGVVPRRLLSWRDGPSRLSRTSKDYAIESFIACKAHFLARGLLRAGPGYVLWGHGDTGRALASALERNGKRPVAIVEVHPGRLGQRIRGAPVIAPGALPALMAREGRPPIVVSVARAGPRREVRTALHALGFIELQDFVCAA